MKMKLCLPIIKKSTKEVEDMIQTHINEYDLAEIYLDYINESQDVILDLIQDLIKNYPNKIILVFRRIDKQPLQLSLDQRKEVINLCKNKNIFIELDINIQKEELEYIKNNNIKVNLITSLHDYEKTSRTSALVTHLKKMDVYHPKIYKIATYCENEKDALHLMHLLVDLKEQNKKAIVLGMGLHGKITRVFGALYGNEITYAPEKTEEQSAPNQLTREELETIIHIFKQ